jgi:hypothetical protein
MLTKQHHLIVLLRDLTWGSILTALPRAIKMQYQQGSQSMGGCYDEGVLWVPSRIQDMKALAVVRLPKGARLHGTLTRQVVQRGTKICQCFLSKSICAMNLYLETHLISSLNNDSKHLKSGIWTVLDSSNII